MCAARKGDEAVSSLSLPFVAATMTAIGMCELVARESAAQTQVTATSSGSDTHVLVAMIAATASVLAAILTVGTALFNESRRRKNDRELSDLKSSNDLALADIKMRSDRQLAEFNSIKQSQHSAEAAKREYEFEALKRLYQECEPLLFQLARAARVVIGRVISLARAAREGDLESGLLAGDVGEESERGFYYRSTIYYLVAPLSLTHALQSRLTSRDVSLDESVARRFQLAEAAFASYTRDFVFAQQAPAVPGYRELANRSESISTRKVLKQGILLGRLEKIAAALLHDNADGTPVLISLGEFERRLMAKDSDLKEVFKPIVEILWNFHPRTHPVFWRILVAQYYVFRTLRRSSLSSKTSDDIAREMAVKPEETDLVWKDRTDEEVLSALHIGHAYLLQAFGQNSPRTAP